MVGVAPAIANAVYHATGRRVRNLPIRIEHMLRLSPRCGLAPQWHCTGGARVRCRSHRRAPPTPIYPLYIQRPRDLQNNLQGASNTSGRKQKLWYYYVNFTGPATNVGKS